METIVEIISFVIGRIILGNVGSFTRRLWFYITTAFQGDSSNALTKGEFDKIIDVEDFKNRLVGFFVIVGILIFVIFLFKL